jgi:hypothetical protein
MPPQPGESVIWIKVSRPTFDLAGVLVSSLGFTSILAAFALLLGAAIAFSWILRRRHDDPAEGLEAVSLDLDRA